MRVLHILTGLGRGGAEASAAKLSERLPNQHFLTLLPGGELRPRLAAHWVDRGVILAGPLKSITATTKTLWRIWSSPPDLIMSWMYHADFAAIFLGTLIRVPIVWNIRNSLDAASVFKSRTHRLLRLLAVLSEILQVPCVSNSRRAITTHIRFGYRKGGWVHIPNGFFLERLRPSPERYASFRREYGLPEDARIVACVARFDPQKNYARFFRLAACLASWAKDVYFVAIGRGVLMENPEIASLVDKSKVGDRVLLLGEVSNTERLYPAFDVLCVTSDAEGFPNVVGEAMASAVPCVCTDVGDCGVIVGDTGFVLPASNEEQFLEATKALLCESLSEKMRRGAAARARIALKYDERIVAEQYRVLLDGMCENANGVIL